MNKNWEPSEEDFNRFLAWLDPDRDRAAQKYETMRRNLISFLNRRGCRHSDELADQAFNQVMRQLPKMIATYEGEPARYITVVARNLHFKYVADEAQQEPFSEADSLRWRTPPPGADDDQNYQCFTHCLQRLPAESRTLVLDYYEKEGREKIIHRRQMAAQRGITANALAIRISRIKDSLAHCVDACLEGNLAYKM